MAFFKNESNKKFSSVKKLPWGGKSGSGWFTRKIFTRKPIGEMLKKIWSKFFSSKSRSNLLDEYVLKKYLLELGTSSGNWNWEVGAGNWNWELSFWHLFLKWKWYLSRAQFHTNWPNSHFLIMKVCIRVNIFELFFLLSKW